MRLLTTLLQGPVLIAALTPALAVGQPAPDVSTTAPADAWPQFRGNPSLSGVSDTTVPAELNLLWTYEADEAIDSSAAIADGAVYVGTYAGSLIALDLDTGEERWTYSTGDLGIGESSPAVAGDLVFVGDLAGVFHAVDTKTGTARWTFETLGEIKSSPVIVGDRVLIGSYDGFLYALAVEDGALLWKYETLNYVHATPALWGGVAYFGGCDEVFHGVRISDGAEVVSLSAGAYTAASPVIADGKVFFGTFDNEVLGLDLATQELLWRYEHPQRHFPFYSSALAVDDTIVIGGRDKMVHAIDAKTGESRWTFTTRARVDSSPATSGGRVYAGSSDGRLYVLDLATGDKLWEFDTAAPLVASPAIAEGRLVIGSEDGVVYLLRVNILSTGAHGCGDESGGEALGWPGATTENIGQYLRAEQRRQPGCIAGLHVAATVTTSTKTPDGGPGTPGPGLKPHGYVRWRATRLLYSTTDE